MRSIFNLYSTFNALFNIQLPIQHSTIHFIFNSSFTHSIIYSTVSTIYSTFNNSFNIQLFISIQLITRGEGPGNKFFFPEPSLFLVSNCIRVTISFPRFTIDRFIRLQSQEKIMDSHFWIFLGI